MWDDHDWEDKKFLYTLLDVDPHATTKEIATAFKKAALRYHSDHQLETEDKKIADEILSKINKAKDVLLDPEKRKLYDHYGIAGLYQMSVTGGATTAEEFRAALEDLSMEKMMEVAHPRGGTRVGINASDAYRYFTGSRKQLFAPELSSVSASQEFQHALSSTEALVFNASAGVQVKKGPYVERKGGIYEQQRGLPEPEFGMSYVNHKSDHDYFTFGASTTGRDVTGHFAVSKPLSTNDNAVFATFRAERRLASGGSAYVASLARPLLVPDGTSDRSVVASAQIGLSDPEVYDILRFNINAKSTKKIHLNASLAFSAKAFSHDSSLIERMPYMSFSWSRREGPGIFVTASLTGHLSMGYNITRRIDRHSYVRFGSAIGSEGFSWNFEYQRAKQNITVPIFVTDELPSLPWLAGLFLAPLAIDWIAQNIILAPIKARRLAAKRDQLNKGVSKAMSEQRFIKREAEECRKKEWDNRGIVILQARYGVRTHRNRDETNPQRLPEWIDVAVALQHRVHHESDFSRLVLLVNSLSKLPGFFDCCPQESKEVGIHYLYNGVYHVAMFEEGEAIILPNQEHRRGKANWRRMDFDWPLEQSIFGVDEEDFAEGSAQRFENVD